MIAGRSAQPLARDYLQARPGLPVQVIGLALTWFTLACSSVVFSEPAAYDAAMLALIALLPLLRLASFSTGVFLFLVAWLVTGSAGLVASARSGALEESVKHTAISIYLSMSAVMIAAFVRKNPDRHGRVVLSGYMFASLLAVAAGIAGYFDLVPGANDLLTRYGRARALFKDPNVYGAFIVPALIYYVHGTATSGAARSILSSLLAGLVSLGLLISFSRGAWFNAVVALMVYGYLLFITAGTNRLRLKMVLLAAFGFCTAVVSLLAVLQMESVASLISERATIALSYDLGPEGRFGGQRRALELIILNPLGIGALEFGRAYHGEDAHNVYLSMFLNTGWVGGFLYFGLVAVTLGAGFRQVLRPVPTQGIAMVMLAAFAGMAAEGMVVDTDHWRHFYVVTGLLWGLILAGRAYTPGLPGQRQLCRSLR